jgi:iron complex transport system ATP-binding protein
MDRKVVLGIQGLSVGYHESRHQPRVVARDISVSLYRGEFVCLLGPNGAGKSTLIRTISGIQPPLCGTVCLEGKPLARYSSRELAQRMSLVLTERVAVGIMSAATLVSLGRHPFTDWTGRLTPRDEEAIQKAMAAVGIEDLAPRPVCELSDGERQKVMIARALAQEPEVMILDEATAFLDLPHRVELMHLLRRLAPADGRAILLSTHDLDLALRCADRLWLLPPGGPFRQGAPEDLVLTDAFAASFSHAGVRFDKASGAFSRHSANRRSIALRGEGIPAMWTCRALERAGYEVVDPGLAQTCVEVRAIGNTLSWQIQGVHAVQCDSVETLLRNLTHAERHG